MHLIGKVLYREQEIGNLSNPCAMALKVDTFGATAAVVSGNVTCFLYAIWILRFS